MYVLPPSVHFDIHRFTSPALVGRTQLVCGHGQNTGSTVCATQSHSQFVKKGRLFRSFWRLLLAQRLHLCSFDAGGFQLITMSSLPDER